MIEADLTRTAARLAAAALKDQLMRLGAPADDITIASDGPDVRVLGVGRAGLRAEYGTRQSPAQRRMARALEFLRRSDRP